MARLKDMRKLIAAVAVAGTVVLSACQGPTAGVSPTPTAEPSVPGSVDSPQFQDGIPPTPDVPAPEGVPEEMKPVWEVWSLLANEHVDRANLNPEVFSEAAIRGMLEALEDPHTNYVSPEAFEIENQDLQGEFEGIGANVSITADGNLVVVAPLDGSPAEEAGIRPGDTILQVDGQSIQGMSLLEAVSLIRGPSGTRVTLLVRHVGQGQPVQVQVERGVIPLESVYVRSQPGDRVAHIRLTNFYADTAESLSQAIEQVMSNGAQGIVIDVRDNPGGLLTSVVDVANMFLDADDLKAQFADQGVPDEMKDRPVVLYEVDGEQRQSNWYVEGGGIATDVPLVILANEFSASASEILVGALQDYDRATVIGATTFGKGSVNILRRLSNGGGLYLTYAHWYTPSGRLIQGNGLTPDIRVTAEDPRQANAAQLDKAIEVLESQISAENKGNMNS